MDGHKVVLKDTISTKAFVTNNTFIIFDVLMDQFYVQGKSAPSAKLCAASIALKFSNIFMNSFQMKLKGAFASIFLVQVLH